jgi:sphingomyelin phosphodiesterase
LGNHEGKSIDLRLIIKIKNKILKAAPCNIFPPDYVKEGKKRKLKKLILNIIFSLDNIRWLYSAVAKNWTSTGLPESLIPDIEKGGFYSVLVSPGLRLVSLNMNICPSLNFWLFINTTDPLGQLQWLSNLLQYSEDNNEKVHIIGHIDPNGCLSSWSSNYYRIINRYENIVRGQFFGHTHFDEFELFYDLNNTTRATNIAYLAPSVTTQSFMNPGIVKKNA